MVEIVNRKVQVGDQQFSLIGGEMHYWRLNPRDWQLILEQVQALGLRFISTYVPWYFHEVEPGQYDFTGQTDPQRNLAAFLDLTATLDFRVLFRPGPYIYAETPNQGVPARVAQCHRLHPDFLHEAEDWMRSVADFVQPYLASNGGPVVMFQADNEPEAWTGFYGEQIGLGTTPGLYQEFLQRTYDGDINALNAAWETSLTNFSRARAVLRPVVLERGYLNRYLDARRFLYWYSAEISRWATARYRDYGIDIPFYSNHYPSMALQNWQMLADQSQASGPDYYSEDEFRRDDWEFQEFLHLLRYTKAVTDMPIIPEFQAGSWHGWHYVTGTIGPRHYRMAGIGAMLAGIVGWNWYMLVNRDNWYMSPINETGHLRPELASVFRWITDVYHAIDPPALEKLTPVCVALDELDRSSEIGGFDDPLRRALYHADVDYECYNLASGRIARPLMLYSGGRWLAADGQQRLLDYVNGGGHLVFFDKLPVLDDHLNPLNMLELHEPDGIIVSNIQVQISGDYITCEGTPCFNYTEVPGTPIQAKHLLNHGYHAQEQHTHFHLPVGGLLTVGYQVQRGQGTITVLGVPPNAALIHALIRLFDLQSACHTLAPLVTTALFRRDDDLYLMAVNNGEHDQHTVVKLMTGLIDDTLCCVHDLLTDTRQSLFVNQTIPLQIPAKSGTVLHIYPAEAKS